MKNRKTDFWLLEWAASFGFSCVFSSYATNADLKDAKK